ncbi:unnamed protein product [Menidia menidia]|uniref:(Atlantic silverside) hypothetical protein n=1 Tax=Menidia menidia TaxID=238744 RepID=A0A8S4BN97_9TELE|nr:unnamed protein product [Menidia menidia]
MASLCKKQQCTIDRRGFRQELDSWRHKLLHCVGFESILEGLIDPELVEDLKLFKDLTPVAVSDWSFDENCLFCCMRRDKVKEHIIGLNKEGLEDTPKPLLVKDQITIIRLEKQAEEFLSAVLRRKDVPGFSDPHIPVVAREILQRMISQFAAEYTSKTSSPQDGCSDSLPHTDQSLPTPPLLTGAPPPPTSPATLLAGPAHNQNPVLSKLLMADQDAPLDLTIKKPTAEPGEQEGVLDLSIKKNRYSSGVPVQSACLSPATSTLKGRSLRADGQVGLYKRSRQDGRRRENFGHSACYKPSSSLAYSLHIKEEADLESDPESPLSHNHLSSPTEIFRNASSSGNSKAHFGALLKLKTSSEAGEHLKAIPRLLKAAGLLTKSLSTDRGNLNETCVEQDLSLSHSSPFDLKIPQVRAVGKGADPCWDSIATEYSGSLSENGFGTKLCSVLPRQIQKRSSVGSNSSGSEKEYWPFPTDRQSLGENYSVDSESDPGNKQPRKKRGRYRQYNTELLEEAIVVVMGGKMSVSKAQSVYGIPHSTLEYKVKERLGTLKHPPKKKMKPISQGEEMRVSQSPEGKGLANSQNTVSVSEKKEESPDLCAAKAKDLQSASTLEQFMAKLCPHHQRQIIDAIGFLQMEVKAHASSNTQKALNSTSDTHGTTCSNAVTPEKLRPQLSIPSQSTSRPEVQELSRSVPSSCAIKKVPENAVSPKTSVTAGPALDLCSPGSGTNDALASPTAHAPLKMKIMTSNAAGKKLSCVLNATLSCTTLEDKQGNSPSSNRAETHSARLSSSIKRHSQTSLSLQVGQRETLGYAKDTPAKVFPVHLTIPSDSARTARKTIRGSSEHRARDPACRSVIDPDLGHCDIVFIDKPITECLKEQRRSLHPRRNARKSTRGHLYADEIWEVKTVRTLAGRGNCPNPMPELMTLVTPKQVLSKPEGVPPVDMPFAGACRDTMIQQILTEETDESVIPGADVVEIAASKVDVVVETSQTDQCQSKGQPSPHSLLICSGENEDTDLNAEQKEREVSPESGKKTVSEESAGQSSFEAVKENEPEPQEGTKDRAQPTLVETEGEPPESITTEEAAKQPPSDTLLPSEPVQQPDSPQPALSQVEEEKEDKGEKIKDEQPQEPQPQELQLETQKHCDSHLVSGKAIATGSAEEMVVKDAEPRKPEAVDGTVPFEKEESECDLSLDALLPPWRRKKGTKIPPTRLKETDAVIVGYVKCQPVSASDRNLRHRPAGNQTSPCKTPGKAGQNVPTKSLVSSALQSKVESSEFQKSTLEKQKTVKPVETTIAVVQEAEPVLDIPSSPVSKFSSRTKQTHKRKKGQDSLPVLSDEGPDHTQSSEPKRQLRSTSQRPSVTPASPPALNVITSISSPESSTLILPPAEQRTTLILPLPLQVSSSPVVRSEPPPSEQSQPNTVPQTVELNTGKAEPMESTSGSVHKSEAEGVTNTKQKLRSAKDVSEDANSEKQTLGDEVSNPAESVGNIKTETQFMPLRSKRVLRKDADASDVALTQKKCVASTEERPAGGEDNSSVSERPTRMPLRSETSRTEASQHAAAPSSPAANKKLTLRSQRSAAPAASAHTETSRQSDVASPLRVMPERTPKAQAKPCPTTSPAVPHCSHLPATAPKPGPPKPTPNKFFETLTGEESQQLITNLNIKFDKMQKGWVQMDKDGQPAVKYRNKSDRQAAIWKSKRRARKPKSSEQQKYSPVQMLFMKGFNLTSICRWYLESTETKSLVIVKKVNTRLPSETQLCFHSSSNTPGTSQGVFPSLQAERLKKHLKKFAIASPVKSNPKSQKLIAKALEQEGIAVKGKEKAELPSNAQTPTKAYSSAKASAQINESQKTSGKSKNPASARILRKYSNIRGKMQVQQTNVRLKGASKMLKSKKIPTLSAAKSAAKTNLKRPLKGQKPALAVSKQMKEISVKLERRKLLAGKTSKKHLTQDRAVKAQGSGRASRDATKETPPKRFSQRLGSPKMSEHNPEHTPKSKVASKKQTEAGKADVEKSSANRVNPAKVQTKEPPVSTPAESRGGESAPGSPAQSPELKAPAPADQVLTRSQRRMEGAAPPSGSPGNASKRAAKSATPQAASPKSLRKGEEPAVTRSGASKRSQAALLPRGAAKGTTTRAQELLETPTKRTRTK